MQSGEFRAFHETSFHHVIICVFPGGANAFWCLAHFPAGAEPTMSVIWLSVFLMPVSCLLERDPDPNAPISNIRVDPRRGRVSWDLNGSVAEITCSIGSVYTSKANNNTYCQFYAFSLCKTTNYTIRVTSGPPFSTLLQYPKPDGKPGAAAENLTCWIHDVDFLECSWAVGRAAPWDVQYHLYLIQPDTYEEWECVHYTTDTHGRRTGGCFDDISGLRNDHYHFLVNGTSEASRIPCTELFATLSEIEILAPPSISGTCNKSYSLMEWKMSSHFSSDFVYELQIYKGADPTHLDTMTSTRHSQKAWGCGRHLDGASQQTVHSTCTGKCSQIGGCLWLGSLEKQNQ
ncbi:interleukin-3 receptor subunit alpha-like isoform 4-T4 [Trichechus inunguis]